MLFRKDILKVNNGSHMAATYFAGTIRCGHVCIRTVYLELAMVIWDFGGVLFKVTAFFM